MNLYVPVPVVPVVNPRAFANLPQWLDITLIVIFLIFFDIFCLLIDKRVKR